MRTRTRCSTAAQTRPSRWSSRTTDVLFVTSGDQRRLTGGNIYSAHAIAALRGAGIPVRTLVLGHARALSAERARLVIVDTIAAPFAVRKLGALRARGDRVVVLALMSRGAVGLARQADRVIACSAALADEIAAAGIARSRIAVVRPGQDAVGRRGAGRRAGVLCVANWTPAKGIHTLVAAIARVPDARLDLVGDAPDPAYAARLRRMLRSPALSGRVRVHGSLGGARLEDRYRAAAVFALPSLRESYGMALGAALAHGLPSVACDTAATREVAGRAAVLVPAGRVVPLADAIRGLLEDRRRRERLSARASRRARSFSTWATMEKAFLRVIRAELARAW